MSKKKKAPKPDPFARMTADDLESLKQIYTDLSAAWLSVLLVFEEPRLAKKILELGEKVGAKIKELELLKPEPEFTTVANSKSPEEDNTPYFPSDE